MRCLTCHELADDPVVVARLKELYDTLDASTTPASVLFPWLPSPSVVTKLRASKKVYDIVDGAIKARLESGVARDDTLQMLIDHGDEKLVTIGVCAPLNNQYVDVLISPTVCHGFTCSRCAIDWYDWYVLKLSMSLPLLTVHLTLASWMVTFLAGDTQRRRNAEDEVHALLSAHSDEMTSSKDNLADLLSNVPLDAWEKCTPVLDKVIWETLRIAQPHTAMRRNVGPDTYVDGTHIPSGAYVVYPFSDVHLNPQMYPDPWRFDPDRPQYDFKYGYVGWGGGK